MTNIQQSLQSNYSRAGGQTNSAVLAKARSGDPASFEQLSEPYRRELLTHCYRIMGSLEDAEDLVQETLLRAWRRLNTYEGRASYRAWLYKIATNVCLDALDRRPRRSLPPAVRPVADPQQPFQSPETEPVWLEPFPNEMVAPTEASPEVRFEAHEAVTLSFLVALQNLPARQRCVLIMSDVLEWSLTETADMLGITISTVNSLLYRARATLQKHYQPRHSDTFKTIPPDEHIKMLLDRYVQAWEKADINGIVALLKEDVTFAMPPSPSWYLGLAAIRTLFTNTIMAGEARGLWRLQPVRVNGGWGLALYHRENTQSDFQAYAIQSVTLDGERMSAIVTFLYPSLFRFFDLPAEIR
ncbi:MAG: RNA polymerase subunit sigma-70 [Anaerolineaceae bacterium]|nr:RNA polymerase subunit sigma-70 [Anaerolineaceae bacterium]